MAILSFTYTKANGEVSNRVVFPLTRASDKYFTIDLSDLDIEDQVAVARDIELAEAEKMEKVNRIMEEFDIRTNFRSFLADRMSNIVED